MISVLTSGRKHGEKQSSLILPRNTLEIKNGSGKRPYQIQIYVLKSIRKEIATVYF